MQPQTGQVPDLVASRCDTITKQNTRYNHSGTRFLPATVVRLSRQNCLLIENDVSRRDGRFGPPFFRRNKTHTLSHVMFGTFRYNREVLRQGREQHPPRYIYTGSESSVEV